MTQPTKQTPHQPWTEPMDGFAPLYEESDLGLAMLIVESAAGHYQPVSVVGTVSEARELIEEDLRHRTNQLELGEESLWPERYLIWARNLAGYYQVASEITDATGACKKLEKRNVPTRWTGA
jgi:hypothetical protein